MNKVDLANRDRNHYQRVIREFDRISAGSSLKLLSDNDPEWLVKMVKELRPNDLADCEFTAEDDHDYAVKLRKNRHVV